MRTRDKVTIIAVCLVTLAGWLGSGRARGEPQGAAADPPGSSPGLHRVWHSGLNMRTDFGTHPIRLDAGVGSGHLDLIVVLDPMFWTDDQFDTDLLLDWSFTPGWSVLAGLRSTAIALSGGTYWQQKSLTGIAGRLPALAGQSVRAQWGLELSILWVKHGGGLPVDAISFASFRHVADNLNFGMFVRIEYARGF